MAHILKDIALLDILKAPDAIDILVNCPSEFAAGTGEASTRSIAAAAAAAAAAANAIYCATGVLVRRAPFTAAQVLTAIA
jgi:CO/xanthine dehydrogenase Mo-binding subunit